MPNGGIREFVGFHNQFRGIKSVQGLKLFSHGIHSIQELWKLLLYANSVLIFKLS